MKIFSTKLRFLRPPGWLLVLCKQGEFFWSASYSSSTLSHNISSLCEIVERNCRQFCELFFNFFFTSWLIYWNGYYSRNERTILSLSLRKFIISEHSETHLFFLHFDLAKIFVNFLVCVRLLRQGSRFTHSRPFVSF